MVLFAFNRPRETKLILETIEAAGQRQVFCIIDGPRLGHASDRANNLEVIELVASKTAHLGICVNVSAENLGVRKRVVSGLDWVFSKVDTAIILEDDCLPDGSFFQFCDQLLDIYKDEKSVGVVSGFNPTPFLNLEGSSYRASRYPLTWGWATWKRVWETYDPLAEDWKFLGPSYLASKGINQPKSKRYWKFNLDKVSRTTNHQIWDYQFTLSQWQGNRISLIPQKSLVQNIGFTLDATHTRSPGHWLSKVTSSAMSFPLNHPSNLLPDARLEAKLEKRLYTLGLTKLLAIELVNRYFSARQEQIALVIRHNFLRFLNFFSFRRRAQTTEPPLGDRG